MRKNSKKKILILSIIGLIGLVIITIGITCAVFTYTKLGTTDNTVTSGTLKFLYTENTGVKTGIKLTNALPISDAQGKALDGDNNVFDFSIEATNTGTEVIPYEVTLRKKSTSTLAEENVKVYLTYRTESIEKEELEPTKYSELTQTSINVGNEIEKTIYKSSVAGGETSYRKDFRLRRWISDDSSQDDINGKEFTATVNVYANVKVVEDTTKYFKNILLSKNSIIKDEPTLTTSSNNTSDESGLYSSTATNTGEPTYYFRGAVENNYVSFAGFTWRIVRINEDGTIRIVMQDGINDNTKYQFNPSYNSYAYMYYTNSQAKTILEDWYNNNIGNKENYSKYVATGPYYCEQAKTKITSDWGSGNATMIPYSSYTPNFNCTTDGNGKGIINSNVGLLTYDEVVFAGGYYTKNNSDYYLYNSNIHWWTISPAGFSSGSCPVWTILIDGNIDNNSVHATLILRATLNIKPDVKILNGDGTKDNPFVIK